MKPIVNYGLSDSLIDAVRKSVEEANLHPNQQKLDVHEPKKDKLTSHDFRKLRAGKHAGKKVKDGIDTHPKSMDEDEQMDEGRIDDLMDKRRLAAQRRHAGDPIVKPVRYNVDGTKYGGSAQPPDPEGADDADDMKKAGKKPKSKSGPHKRRSPFSAKSAQRLGKLDQQAK